MTVIDYCRLIRSLGSNLYTFLSESRAVNFAHLTIFNSPKLIITNFTCTFLLTRCSDIIQIFTMPTLMYDNLKIVIHRNYFQHRRERKRKIGCLKNQNQCVEATIKYKKKRDTRCRSMFVHLFTAIFL